MSASQCKASLTKPAWATASRIDDETPATVYHSSTIAVIDQEHGGEQHTVELYVADRLALTDDGVDYLRDQPSVEVHAGVVSLTAAADIAYAIVQQVGAVLGESNPADAAYVRDVLTKLSTIRHAAMQHGDVTSDGA